MGKRDTPLIETGKTWFASQGWKPFPFQLKAWRAYLSGKSGIVCAPTGYGKTYSLCVPALLDGLAHEQSPGLRVLWITPIRALAKEIRISWIRAIDSFASDWEVGLRTGDTASAERQKQLKHAPEVLITTPESLHLLLASKGYPRFFGQLDAIVIDEWHELVGSKRGVLMELALSRLKTLRPELRIWAISATIGNVEQARQMLFGADYDPQTQVLIQSKQQKKIEVIPVLPDDIASYPWAGYFGTRMLDKVLPIVHNSRSTIIFTNTRSMCERWYQKLLEADETLAGVTAMHHGSISREIRDWVEESLYQGKLKAVVSTSSLDLGVDFRPVESVVQIGSPKGVARCMQRAGRSGHQPGAVSRIYFVPTHALELIEAAGLRKAIKEGLLEVRTPHIRSFDVLVQYLVTLAVSDGFRPEEIFPEIKSTFCYASINEAEWRWILDFIVHGGSSLQAYDEFKKAIVQDGVYRVTDRRIALRHRLSIGTIVGAMSMQIKYLSGKRLGTIEETFIMRLNPGDVFWFAGRSLEFIRIKDNVAFVRRSKKKTGNVPSWQGGRMPLSSQLSQMLRAKVVEFHRQTYQDQELRELKPLLDLQEHYSRVPRQDEFLIEVYHSSDGHHLLMYPFEGRFVHEGMGALMAHRIARIRPITFTIAMNDYGFELVSDQPIPIDEALQNDLFAYDNLEEDIQRSINEIELAKRKFYEVASIAGMVFRGFPGKRKKERHLQASTGLIFEVFKDYEPDNLLYLQTYDEALYFQLEKDRLRAALQRIRGQTPVITRPDRFTPFALPIIADSLREKLSSEKLLDRIQKMKLQLLANVQG